MVPPFLTFRAAAHVYTVSFSFDSHQRSTSSLIATKKLCREVDAERSCRDDEVRHPDQERPIRDVDQKSPLDAVCGIHRNHQKPAEEIECQEPAVQQVEQLPF